LPRLRAAERGDDRQPFAALGPLCGSLRRCAGGAVHQRGLANGSIRERRSWTRNCRAHEVENLYVVDGSFFPSSAAVNPALTIMANALRVGDHVLKRLN
jgi:choline dehydrogenase-like flavoprotein